MTKPLEEYGSSMPYDLVHPVAFDNATVILHCFKRLRREWFLTRAAFRAISALDLGTLEE